MHSARLTLFAGLLAVSVPTWAASYNFDVQYRGQGIGVLETDSDDPRGLTLQSGDSFVWTISAQPGHRWTVLSGGTVFSLMALGINEPGFRTSNHMLTLSNQGQTTLTLQEVDSVQTQIHMGTNAVQLQAGLVFDQLRLDYTLLSSRAVVRVPDPSRPNLMMDAPGEPIGSSPTWFLPIFGLPERARDSNTTQTSYAAAPVPEPATWALWLAGLAAAGAAARRGRQAQIVTPPSMTRL